MKTIARILLLGTVLSGTGCTALAYGWKQEREMLRQVGASFAAGVRNENDLLPPPWAHAWHKEIRQAQPYLGISHGIRSDLHRVMTP